ncbi:MAG TPA: AtpZ/AtpI family protein [Bacteroidales bacterium]|nr:AtpZ/AtpI family protein [Bacteroidales bacterium]
MVTPQQSQKKKDQKNLSGKKLSDFAKYSGMAFQMFAIIFITTWGGMKLDKLTGTKKPVFTIILSLLGVFAAIYNVLKDFIKRDK